jgi:hypothetical protein
MKSGPGRSEFPWYPLTAFLFLTLGMAGLRYLFSLVLSRDSQADKKKEPSGIGNLKAAELPNRRRNRTMLCTTEFIRGSLRNPEFLETAY